MSALINHNNIGRFIEDVRGEPVEIVSIGAGKKSRMRPLRYTLAAAGLATLMSVTFPGEHGGMDTATSAGPYSISYLETNSPDLGVFGKNLAEVYGISGAGSLHLPDVDIVAIDFRDDSPTFGRGLEQTTVSSSFTGVDETLTAAIVSANVQSVAAENRPVRGSKKDLNCVIWSGGKTFLGDISMKVAKLGSFLPIAGKASVISDYEFDKATFWHEFAHCLDKEIFREQTEPTRWVSVAEEEYNLKHLVESRADAFMVIMMAREARTLEDARRIASTLRDARVTASVADSVNERGRDLSSDTLGGAPYYTAVAMDAAMTFVEDTGLETLRAMSLDEIYGQVRKLASASAMPLEDYREFRSVIRQTSSDDNQMLLFHPRISEHFPDYENRVYEAMDSFGITATNLLVPHYLDATPEWMNGGFAAAPEARASQDLARHLARLIDSDMRAGVEISRIARLKDGIGVFFREPSGEETVALVQGETVRRYNSGLRLASLGDDRPALEGRGLVMHADDGVVVDGPSHGGVEQVALREEPRRSPGYR